MALSASMSTHALSCREGAECSSPLCRLTRIVAVGTARQRHVEVFWGCSPASERRCGLLPPSSFVAPRQQPARWVPDVRPSHPWLRPRPATSRLRQAESEPSAAPAEVPPRPRHDRAGRDPFAKGPWTTWMPCSAPSGDSSEAPRPSCPSPGSTFHHSSHRAPGPSSRWTRVLGRPTPPEALSDVRRRRSGRGLNRSAHQLADALWTRVEALACNVAHAASSAASSGQPARSG